MSKIIRLVSFTLFLILVLNACNLPSNAAEEPASTSSNTVLTAAAQTVEANLTQAAILNPPTVPSTQTLAAATSTIAIATTSVPPTNTPPPSPTQTCDVAQFIDDVANRGVFIPLGVEKLLRAGDQFAASFIWIFCDSCHSFLTPNDQVFRQWCFCLPGSTNSSSFD